AGRVGGFFGPFNLVVGTMERRNSLGLLVREMQRYRARGGRGAATLVLFGAPGWRAEAELAEIERLRRESKLVWFRGGTDDQLLLLYNAASLLVLPSHYEGFGLPAIEAMACGTPVLASNCSSLPEVTGAAGVLLPPDDAEAWADALRENSENRAKRDELIAASLKQAAQFSWLRAAEQTLAVYRRALGQEEPATPADMVESWRR
ncbi:MAG: glycosyltransferase family 4 protein, partial [Thermomicrobiales bacterium]